MFKPSNYSKVAGNEWLPRETKDYLLRMDWIPQVREYHEWQENIRWWNDYSKNTGVAYKDIVYPYRSGYYSQTDGSRFISSFNVSQNILRLYK